MELDTHTFEDVTVVSPSGRIDHNSAEDFQAALVAEVENCGPDGKMVLDLSGVDYMSSVGLRALMVAAKEAKKTTTNIVVSALQADLKEIFEISRFHFIFKTFDETGDALESLSPEAVQAYQTARS
ncbi:MAG: STAS domain-containing protein [Alphaproteobacteria bacterium]|nr:STAS domain-containing protein [Alphaproteobacteria bacterium]